MELTSGNASLIVETTGRNFGKRGPRIEYRWRLKEADTDLSGTFSLSTGEGESENVAAWRAMQHVVTTLLQASAACRLLGIEGVIWASRSWQVLEDFSSADQWSAVRITE